LRAQQWDITIFLQATRMWCLLQASFEDDSVDKSTRSRHISWSHRTVPKAALLESVHRTASRI
jgi:hypothetical protein